MGKMKYTPVDSRGKPYSSEDVDNSSAGDVIPTVTSEKKGKRKVTPQSPVSVAKKAAPNAPTTGEGGNKVKPRAGKQQPLPKPKIKPIVEESSKGESSDDILAHDSSEHEPVG